MSRKWRRHVDLAVEGSGEGLKLKKCNLSSLPEEVRGSKGKGGGDRHAERLDAFWVLMCGAGSPLGRPCARARLG